MSTSRGEQPINNRVSCTEIAPPCTNCRVLKRDYGRVLFERDLARKNLQITNFRLLDVLTHHRNDGTEGIDFFFHFHIGFLLVSNTVIDRVNI